MQSEIWVVEWRNCHRQWVEVEDEEYQTKAEAEDRAQTLNKIASIPGNCEEFRVVHIPPEQGPDGQGGCDG